MTQVSGKREDTNSRRRDVTSHYGFYSEIIGTFNKTVLTEAWNRLISDHHLPPFSKQGSEVTRRFLVGSFSSLFG